MSLSEFDTIAHRHPELKGSVARFRQFLACQRPGSSFRLSEAYEFVRGSRDGLEQIAKMLLHSSILKIEEIPVCPKRSCDLSPLTLQDDTSFWCDLCETTFENRKGVKMDTVHTLKSPVEAEASNSVRGGSSPVKLFSDKLHPWGAELLHDDFTGADVKIQEFEMSDMLRKIERYGLVRFRMTGHSPDEEIVRFIQKQIGPVCPVQNDFPGDLKTLSPRPDGPANSGEAIGDLAPHVDGTQDDETPALLLFQYISGADYGGTSEFVDMAKVLEDIEPTRRNQLILNLSRPDAATFAKKGLSYTGPLFTYKHDYMSAACRLRFDDGVIKLHPDCQKDYDFLKERVRDTRYHLSFISNKGDIVIFDNWRLLHSRDRVLGQNIRQHRRMWIQGFSANNRVRYGLGLRFASPQVLGSIERMNSSG